MTFHEKSNWVAVVVAVPALLIYAVLVVPQFLSKPLAEITWVAPMVFAILGIIVANVLGNIVAAMTNPAEAEKHDLRDQQISQYGVRVGSWLVVAGACMALVLAMIDAPHFWIANALFIGGMAASLTSSIAKIAAYRGTFEPW